MSKYLIPVYGWDGYRIENGQAILTVYPPYDKPYDKVVEEIPAIDVEDWESRENWLSRDFCYLDHPTKGMLKYLKVVKVC